MPESLNLRQLETLEKLVSIPSWYVPANDRHGRQRGDESMILDTIAEYFPKSSAYDVHRIGSVPTRRSCVVVKGERVNPVFTLVLYSHVDTVYPQGFPKKWNSPLQMSRDGDSLYGLGVYDMKAGVMSIIDLLQEVDIPAGVRVIGAFCPDEEGESLGASDFVKWLQESKIVPDLVLSPEIATFRKRQEKDHPKDIIVNRVGHVKSILGLTTEQMHDFDADAVDAGEEIIEVINALKAQAEIDARYHENFGKERERFKVTEMHIQRADGFSNTTSASARFSYYNFPGNSIDDVLKWERGVIERVAKERRWTRNRVKRVHETFSQTPNETSYEPYALDLGDQVSQMVLEGVQSVYGGYRPKAGSSTSDVNFIRMKYPNTPMFDIGATGRRAHHMNEEVSMASIALNISFMRHMIHAAIPGYLAQS